MPTHLCAPHLDTLIHEYLGTTFNKWQTVVLLIDHFLSIHASLFRHTYLYQANSIFFCRNNTLEVPDAWLHVLDGWNPPASQPPSLLLSAPDPWTWVTLSNTSPRTVYPFDNSSLWGHTKTWDFEHPCSFFVFNCVLDVEGIRQKDLQLYIGLFLVCVCVFPHSGRHQVAANCFSRLAQIPCPIEFGSFGSRYKSPHLVSWHPILPL